MQILTLHSWSNAFDFEKLLHTRKTQLMICTVSCAVSHWGLAGSTALTQTCAARDRGFLPHFYCLTATMLPQTAISNWIPHHTENITCPSSLLLYEHRPIRLLTAIWAPQWKGEYLGFSPTLYFVRWLHVVRREVSRWQLLTLWSWASCFNRVGSPALFLTVRNVPSGIWKWRNRTAI